MKLGVCLGRALLSLAFVAGLGVGPVMAQGSEDAGQAAADTPARKMSIAFQDLAWGDAPAVVKKKLAKYKFGSQDSDSITFKGAIAGEEDASIMAVFTPKSKKLCKVIVWFSPQSSFSSLKSQYERFQDILKGKYGAPENDFSFFQNPYEDGDGYEETAVKVGKAHFASFWFMTNGALSCKIDKDMTVTLGYEGNDMMELRKTEQAGAAKSDL